MSGMFELLGLSNTKFSTTFQCQHFQRYLLVSQTHGITRLAKAPTKKWLAESVGTGFEPGTKTSNVIPSLHLSVTLAPLLKLQVKHFESESVFYLQYYALYFVPYAREMSKIVPYVPDHNSYDCYTKAVTL